MGIDEHTAQARASDGADDARPLVSVIIPHLDDTGRLAECVAALEQQTFPRKDFEIVVADNGSTCGIDAVRAAARPAPTSSKRPNRVLVRRAMPAHDGPEGMSSPSQMPIAVPTVIGCSQASGRSSAAPTLPGAQSR